MLTFPPPKDMDGFLERRKTSKKPFEVMLAHNYMDRNRKATQNPLGWYMSEKYDGERAQWDGTELLSRNNNKIPIPEWFRAYLEELPHKVDGELFLGNGRFFDTGIFRASKVDEAMWESVRYMVFDIPDSTTGRTWLERQAKLQQSIVALTAIPEDKYGHRCNIELVNQTEIKTKAQMDEYYGKILRQNGEGIMLSNPNSLYENARSANLLKYKPLFDNEGVIVSYKEGNGKFTGKLGSFRVQPLINGKPMKSQEFGLSGMNGAIRTNYLKSHPIGTVVTYAYRSLTAKGKPFHPSYKGKRGFYNPLPTELPCGLMKKPIIEPAAIEPEAIEPEAIEPEAIEPEAIEPEAIEPEAIEPADAPRIKLVLRKKPKPEFKIRLRLPK